MNKLFPTSLVPNIAELLPKQPLHFKGPTLASVSTMFYLSLITVRSVLHFFLPDGGAQSIATIDISGASEAHIIALFGQWGASQLLLAALLWLLILRYAGFIPLALLVLAIEPFARGLAGHLKPIVTVGIAPGAALNWVAAPVLLALFWLSLCPASKRR